MYKKYKLLTPKQYSKFHKYQNDLNTTNQISITL